MPNVAHGGRGCGSTDWFKEFLGIYVPIRTRHSSPVALKPFLPWYFRGSLNDQIHYVILAVLASGPPLQLQVAHLTCSAALLSAQCSCFI